MGLTIEGVAIAFLAVLLGVIGRLIWIFVAMVLGLRDRIIKLENKIEKRVRSGNWEHEENGNGDKFLD